MPRFDDCHEKVVAALQKDGWRIETEQFILVSDERRGYVDVRAVREVNGTRQQIMLVEVKCFPDRVDTTQELYIAIGQYIIYRSLMVKLGLGIPLYLAVPDQVYNDIFDSSVRWAITDSRIKLIIVDLDAESIKQWIE